VTGENDREAWLAEGNAKQARKRVAAKELITDEAGRVLLVNPTYKEDWDLPGGMAEANEPPTQALAREIYEELNLHIAVGRLLALDWIGPHGPWDDQLTFLFDCGSLTGAQIGEITLTDAEISEYRLFRPDEALQSLRADVAERLARAIQTRNSGHTQYTEIVR
jgi:8-oxo-dGTP pyrophosphatase MutT (NUDIX family)